MPRSRISFATFNLFNLNLPDQPLYHSGRWTQARYKKKISWTAGVISSIGADVWGFQELWHQEALSQVFDKRSDLRDRYDLLVPRGHAGAKIACAAAVLSTLTRVGDPEWIEEFPSGFALQSQGDDGQTEAISVRVCRFSRPVLRFRIRPRAKSKPISVYVAHLKSKRPTRIYRESWYDKRIHSKHAEAIGAAISTIRRTAEATALRMIVTDHLRDNDDPVVVLGDFNDGDRSNTIDIVSGGPNYLRAPWSLGGSDTDLYSVAVLDALRRRRKGHYTHEFENTREALDDILVSRELYDHSKNRVWGFRGATVLNDHVGREDHKETGSSDHGVVMAGFEYRPALKT